MSDEIKPDKFGRKQLNANMLGKLLVIAALMFGFGYALVPIYKQICELTGVNILTPKDISVKEISNSQIDRSREVIVEFDANTQGPWRFRPTVSSMKVHPGEMTQVLYEVVNKQSYKMDAQAIPSYAPQQAAAYFKKMECFCFKQQTLEANEARQMPVVFYIDPELPKEVKTITLSYTFFEVGGKPKTAAVDAVPKG
ncbi:cytochrome c oxidase assembly protein [Undibacterium sp. RTI2.1]|uniref:cytochrome c oxidase assembly protein n=1 Tax=unclassified Undibacterium TaxID=2630295 RepID=UPI002AB5D03E|nr:MULTISPECIES: cytochrome c oxidase assembly protein [unclassified Undibacterium]MDY7540088.1 cytochrome c oxidase assembly protein [Undibacterium sp. 5I1]MEB0031721.1 cytochrome c oxidase assembly protein [Undibacterium sp. RTI2.1]MEB0118027.1 cytochrome c oxidase assembly protein [Undibacterium sp. RTI2.2]MEB0231801.1 cytochrome c oxidase assembly protein [Undibacterium sp. 10I3]MEB0259190.1 cytochrome c oxidase assembly protein [Undibacterium sp. 5I1]